MRKQESEIKPLDREELLQRLEALAEHNREAVVVFAARCALRVLPFTAVDSAFDYWPSDKRSIHAQSVFIACIVGLEHKGRSRSLADADVDFAVNDAATDAASAAIVAKVVSVAAEAAYLSAAVYASSVSTASYAASIAASASGIAADSHAASIVDLILLEQGDVQSVKCNALWPDATPSIILERVDGWSEAMRTLKFEHIVQVYKDLLQGENYSKEKILSLINDWYQQYGHQDANESASDSESSKDQSSQTITKYDQTHAHLYDGLAQKDSLGRQRLVDAIADILAAKENIDHQTIGLLGDWGAGKSTFIKLLKSALAERSTAKFLFAEFNAWEYEHTDHMQAGIAREALKGLVADLGWRKKLWLALKFSWQEKPWQVIRIVLATAGLIAGTVIGSLQFEGWQQIAAWIGFGSISTLIIWKFVDSLQALFKSPLVNEWKSLLSLPDYERYLGTIPVMKQQIQKLCELRLRIGQSSEKQRRLLLVVDDLDRCSHGGVVKTLEAVRLIMGIPQVIVIIAIDQRIALASLALHYKDLAGYHEGQDPGAIARDYLGKVIQLPVQLNAADGETVAAFVDEVLLNHIVKPTLEQDRKMPGFSNEGHDSSSIAPTAEQVKEKRVEPESIQSQPDAGNLNETSPTPELVSEVVEYQLSPAEKSAFKACVAQYEFHNPRQLKRLYNSFNLLRHLYGGDRAGEHLQVLFWLEYLNNLLADERREAEKNRNEFLGLDDERYRIIELQVKPFVLPALTVSAKNVAAQSFSEDMANK